MRALSIVPITMSSREIAELTGKRHPDVKRDIEKLMLDLGEDVSRFAHIYLDTMNREQTEFRLDRELTETLLLGYSAPLRRKVLARLRELEGILANPAAALNDPATLRSILLQNVEKVIALEAQVSELRPAQEALMRISTADGSLCITEAAKALQMRPKDLFQWLRQNGWIYRRPGAAYDLGYQSKTTAGLLEHKVTTVLRADGSEKVTEQVRITAKGLTKLASLIKSALRSAA
ncbi:phage antirepressor KilAC domain-containing protein [Sinorhizobium medicae]|uniref:phage antirepressor KilAC domain-containing protein n=1 Tax=Sinorhizobium medicae TaxID=110321 RepID=UPI00041E04D8|nr:phage regulatory protein/antirepressor Ant [Sinorhizobium medicae]